jgi:class 3 adenylate cyclase
MAEEHVNRRLAAILAADVVGYSRLMGADEAGTLAALKRHRETVFSPAVGAHNGRIVKLIGDGVIAEFGSVVDAVSCALSVQRSSAATSDPSVSQPAIVLRIGINLGDVIIEGDDIYGDGVNIAARLEPLAEPGGVCVSSIVNESVGNRIDARFQDGGDVSVKNIDRPIRVWKWHPGATVANAPAKPQSGITDELLSPNLAGALELLVSRFPAGSASGTQPYTHRGEEGGLVVEGMLELWIENEKFLLKAGDSFSFPSTKPHRYRNPSKRETVVLWVITPPTY